MPLVTDATGNDLTYIIIGMAMEVHNEIGPGFKEDVYEKALAFKIKKGSVEVERQYHVDVEYEGEPVASFDLDLFVAKQVVVEIKAFSRPLSNREVTQTINYLKTTGAPVGLLFNFGRARLELRRVFPGRATKLTQRVNDGTTKE